jgi:hypothetical protein
MLTGLVVNMQYQNQMTTRKSTDNILLLRQLTSWDFHDTGHTTNDPNNLSGPSVKAISDTVDALASSRDSDDVVAPEPCDESDNQHCNNQRDLFPIHLRLLAA